MKCLPLGMQIREYKIVEDATTFRGSATPSMHYRHQLELVMPPNAIKLVNVF